MSARPGEFVRIMLGADSNTTIKDNNIVGTYEGPAIASDSDSDSDSDYTTTITPNPNATFQINDDIDYTFKTATSSIPHLNYIQETTTGTVPAGSLVWATFPHPVAIEFRQFVKDSNDGRGILSFTEWAMKNCDGIMLRQVRDAYRAKYGQNIVFDGDSMFYMMDRCKRLEERLDKIDNK